MVEILGIDVLDHPALYLSPKTLTLHLISYICVSMWAGRVILSEEKLNLVLDRLAHQLIEYHGDFRDSCIIGIQPRGIPLSDRLIQRLHNLGSRSIPYGLLDITFHRDDFRTRNEPLKANITKM